MKTVLRFAFWPILLLSSVVLLIGCTPQGDTTSDSSDSVTTDDTTDVVYKWFTLTAPNGKETWNQGSTYTITWQKGNHIAKDVGYIGIKLYEGSGDDGTLVHTIEEYPTEDEHEAGKENDGSYSWTIPVNIPVGSNYEIRIRAKDKEGNVEHDESNAAFTISTGGALSVQSTAFGDGQIIPEQYTCDGTDTRLKFTVSGVPSDAESLVMFVDDLDGTPKSTTTSTDWNHWVVFNIPIVSSINPYSLPAGAGEGTNDAGDRGFESICPPGEKGDRTKHTYRFELYAIDTTFNNFGPDTKRSTVVTAMKSHLVEKSSFTGYFESP